MSVNYSVSVVAGIKMEERTSKTKVTRYREDTGEPYEKDVNSTFWLAENGWVLKQEAFDRIMEDDDDLINLTDCDSTDLFVLGVGRLLGESEPDEAVGLFPTGEELIKLRNDATAKLSALGYSGPIVLYSVSYASY